jgi:hypothetical protein
MRILPSPMGGDCILISRSGDTGSRGINEENGLSPRRVSSAGKTKSSLAAG